MPFELIKSRIARYSKSSQITACLAILDTVQRDKRKDYPFWNVIVLIKWILIHTDDFFLQRRATINEVNETLSLIQQFEYERGAISFKRKEDIKRSLRIIAYQQFWYQDHIANHVFDRQILLFSILKSRHDIDKEFKLLTGFSILEFLTLCYSVFLYFNLENLAKGHKYDGILADDYFDVFKEKWSREKLMAFTSLLTLNSLDEIASLQKMSDEGYQLYETNFLSTKPFLKYGRQLKTPHKAIFNQTCKYFIYDFLKSRSSDFSPELGKRMEKYIQLGLDEIKANYETEVEVKKRFPHVTKVVDFVVNSNTFIEAKAIELHPNAAVLRYSQILSKNLNESIVKAYCQMLSTANAINPVGIFYGLIVTYKEMYLGFGFDAWDEFLKEKVNQFVSENKIPISLLPPENICFIDLETWDYIVQAVKIHNCSIPEIIEKAKESNNESFTRKMLMEQILHEYFPVKKFELSYLDKVHVLVDLNQKES